MIAREAATAAAATTTPTTNQTTREFCVWLAAAVAAGARSPGNGWCDATRR